MNIHAKTSRRKQTPQESAVDITLICVPYGRWLRMMVTVVIALLAALTPFKHTLSQVSMAKPDMNGAIHIPFTLYYLGVIVLDADLSGVHALSELDTGGPTLAFPMFLNVRGKSSIWDRLASVTTVVYAEQGDMIHMRPVTVDYIRLGEYTAEKVYSCALAYKAPSKGRPWTDNWEDTKPLLGNSLFRDHVLTIDYEHRELVVYPATYDPEIVIQNVTNAAEHAQDSVSLTKDEIPATRVLPMELLQGDRHSIGVPVIDAVVGGIKCHMLLDTGGAANQIGLDAQTMRKIRQLRKRLGQDPGEIDISDNPWLGSARMVKGLRDVTTTVASSPSDPRPFQITTNAQQMKLGPKIDGMLGWEFLRHFRRVTIDFVRRKIYFDPWTPGSPQDRTGIFANARMATTRQRRAATINYGIDSRLWDASFGPSLSDTPNTSGNVLWIDALGIKGELWDDGTVISVEQSPYPLRYGDATAASNPPGIPAGLVKIPYGNGKYVWAVPGSKVTIGDDGNPIVTPPQ